MAKKCKNKLKAAQSEWQTGLKSMKKLSKELFADVQQLVKNNSQLQTESVCRKMKLVKLQSEQTDDSVVFFLDHQESV